jgi:hypothetical protein
MNVVLCATIAIGLITTVGCASEPSEDGVNNGPVTGSGDSGAGASGATAGDGGSSSGGGTGNDAAASGGMSEAGMGTVSMGEAGMSEAGMAGQGDGGGMPGAIGGYMMSGSWRGFAWTATSPMGGMITPANFGAAFDFPLCAKGMVNAGDSNVAMVGWNLNQATTPAMAPAMTVTPKAKGITVAITNPGMSELRLQLQGPDGATSATDRWCAIIPGTGGFISYDTFNTECWAGGKGTAYAGQPIVAAILLVPGKVGAASPFDFCVSKLAETDETGSTPSTGCSLSGSPGEGGGSISGSDTRVVTREGRQYVVQNNVWNGNSSGQTLMVTGTAFNVSAQSNSAGTSGPPTSFPSVFIGSNFGHSSSGSGLPKQISALKSVQTGWKWSGSNGTHNAAYDVWFSTGAGGDSGNPSGAYLMVWFGRTNGPQPLGSGPTGSATIGGKPWQYWVCSGGCQNGVPVVSYIPPSGSISEWSFDLNDFIKHAVTLGVLNKDWYLSNVFAGFEIWSGGTGLKTDNFCAVVN